MKFLFAPKKAISLEKKFNLQDHWAGRLPEQAQEILDIFHFPDVYEQYQTPVPKGYTDSPFSADMFLIS